MKSKKTFSQGRYRLINPSKYLGDKQNIIFRSSWEYSYMCYLDKQPNVIEWGSEPFFIKYWSTFHSKYKRYFPDFYVKAKSKDDINEFVIEIKPYRQTIEPKRVRSYKYTDKDKEAKRRHRYLKEAATYVVNKDKWKAAKKLCEHKGWTFRLITEKDIRF